MSVGSTVGHSGSHGCRNSVAKIACHGIRNVTKSQVYHIWSGIPGPTRQFPLAISLSIKLELLGLLELTTLENGFLLSKRKESTPYYSRHKKRKKKLITHRRSLQLEETTLRTPRNWATPFQRNLSSSSSLLQVTFRQVANLKFHKGLLHITKVGTCQCCSLLNLAVSTHSNIVIIQCTPPRKFWYASSTYYPLPRSFFIVELGLVIGKGGRDISQLNAESHIAGYSMSVLPCSHIIPTRQ